MSNSLLNMIAEQLSPAIVSQIGKQIGQNPAATKNVITSALPVLVSALAGNTRNQGGAESLFNAVTKKHDGSVFSNLGSLISNPDAGEGNGILSHIFGQKKTRIEQNIGDATGVGHGGSASVMKILAPMVLGALGQQTKSQGLQPNDLSRVLAQSQEDFGKEAPKELGAIGRLLDSDGDGKIADDVAGIGMKLLGSFLRR